MHLIYEAQDFPRCQYLNFHPSLPILYATGTSISPHIHAFNIETDGNVTLINRQPTSGLAPCYVSVDLVGQFGLVVNYSSPENIGSIMTFPLGSDGQILEHSEHLQLEGRSVHPQRQNASHPHMIVPSPDNKFILAPDLGTDKVMIYRLDQTTGKLRPHDTPFLEIETGSGPRHLAFHPSQPYLYVLSELEPILTPS